VATHELLSRRLPAHTEGGGDPRPTRADMYELGDQLALALRESSLLVDQRCQFFQS
jgi:hypothetical protein